MGKKVMVTSFGKQVRKYRIDITATLFDMAQALDVSTAYLSAMELGKKKLSNEFVKRVVHYFSTHGIDAQDLYPAADRSRKEITVNAQDEDANGRELIGAFARRFSQLPQNKRDKLWELLGEQKDGENGL